MVPPTLSEVRQDMLEGEFQEFVQELEGVNYNHVPEDESHEHPVDEMAEIVMVKVVP